MEELLEKSKTRDIDLGPILKKVLEDLQPSLCVALKEECKAAIEEDALYLHGHMNLANETLKSLTVFDPKQQKRTATKKNQGFRSVPGKVRGSGISQT